MAWVYHHVSDLSSVGRNCLQLLLMLAVLQGILRFIHFLFQDERALPKGDFFPPERPQQLPRKCLNYYGYDFEFNIF